MKNKYVACPELCMVLGEGGGGVVGGVGEIIQRASNEN